MRFIKGKQGCEPALFIYYKFIQSNNIITQL